MKGSLKSKIQRLFDELWDTSVIGWSSQREEDILQCAKDCQLTLNKIHNLIEQAENEE